jgi:hypothetical protein
MDIHIASDFDGTIVKHKYPKIGEPVPEAIYWLGQFQSLGAFLYLFTMRSNAYLDEAVEYCRQSGIIFTGVNENPSQKIWTTSPKCYANLYIDDAAYGCPLIYPKGERPYVDWMTVGPDVYNRIKDSRNE